jgi:putative PIG3 family NAD(P)H quinone oxidoreductase
MVLTLPTDRTAGTNAARGSEMAGLPQNMTAIAIREPGGPEVLTAVELPVPRPGPDELLVRVAAAGVNRPDVAQRSGAYPPPPGVTEIPGLEIAGEVAAAGRSVRGIAVGDKVTALVPGGGYAEYCLADHRSALPVPSGLATTEAAALPETFFTVWSNVFDIARLQSGETLLVHGGTSGIGTTAIQLGKAFGATVIVTAGSEEKCAACRALGADLAVNYRTEDFVAAVKEFAGGADVILDMVGGDYVARNYRAAAEDGRIVQIATIAGGRAEVELWPLMKKGLMHTGSLLRPRSAEFKGAIAAQLKERVWPLIESGGIRPVIDSTFPLNAAADAHRRIEDPDHVGKIVLEVGGG